MLAWLRLANFRLFGALEWTPGPGLTFVVGANGQGKTSLLEAAAFLLRLQSPRTSSPSECVRFGTAGFAVEGEVAGRRLLVSFSGRLRRAWLDGKPPASLAEYLSVGRVVWLSSADMELAAGAASARRRFLDALGAQTMPGYLERLRAYERALRARNSLLREGRPRREVAAFEPALADAGDFLLAARAELAAVLAPLAGQAWEYITQSGMAFALRYLPGAQFPMTASLEATRAEEERLRLTVAGPHRDDLEVLVGGRQAAVFASEGQCRAVALALKLAQAQQIEAATGQPPLLLVDDIFGELDPARRNAFLLTLPRSSQALITTTSVEWIQSLPLSAARLYQLHDGRLHPESP